MKSIAICPGEVSLHQMASQFHLVLFKEGLYPSEKQAKNG
jgi:hypothetical protein